MGSAPTRRFRPATLKSSRENSTEPLRYRLDRALIFAWIAREKMKKKKYDPIVRKHVEFTEHKIK